MNDQPEWWQDFFSGPVLDFVRESRDQETTLEEAHFIEQSLGLQPGDKILDVPCGGGRLALELAGRGYQVTGVDISAELLESAGR
jgi:cyclopropane fatty-acyl-phospholipid synthase-like methyltransferase